MEFNQLLMLQCDFSYYGFVLIKHTNSVIQDQFDNIHDNIVFSVTPHLSLFMLPNLRFSVMSLISSPRCRSAAAISWAVTSRKILLMSLWFFIFNQTPQIWLFPYCCAMFTTVDVMLNLTRIAKSHVVNVWSFSVCIKWFIITYWLLVNIVCIWHQLIYAYELIYWWMIH